MTDQWMPEIQHFLPNTPIILVGNKKDLEHDPKIIHAKKIGYHPVTYEEASLEF